MGSVWTISLLFLMGSVMMVISVQPHKQIKGNVESLLLKSGSWNWRHLNMSVKVDSPVSVYVTLTSHYRLTGKHFTKYLKQQRMRDCASILKQIPNTKGKGGVYTIYPDLKTGKLVYCDMTTDGGGWTVFQRRIDGTVNFNRDWKSYKEGFGKTEGEYWLGNEALHLLTKATKQELRVDLQKFTGEKAFAKYSMFTVGSGSDKYKLTVGGYRGTAGDSLQPHSGYKFSTKDQDNDIWAKDCVAVYSGGWWFHNCVNCNLNGSYHKSAVKSTKAVFWYQFGKSWFSLKSAKMMIRSKA